MSELIDGKPYWKVVFDKDGDVDRATVETLVREAGDAGLTDLVIFSHGWNNDRRVADKLYHAWFTKLVPQLRDDATRKTGLVGLFWPAARWSDEPIPDFESSTGTAHAEGGAALHDRATVSAGDPDLDPADVAQLESMFPEGAPQLHRIAELLSAPPDRAAVDEMFVQLRSFAENTAGGFDDGERDGRSDGAAMPGMLDTDNDPRTVFDDFVLALSDCGVEFDSDDIGGAAGLGDMVRTVWNGAKEALRQLTYYEMKNRAGVVGKRGLGPLIGELHDRLPGLRVHLVGHSFGGRVVSFALAGLPEQPGPSPVKSVTLLQPAFSAFAFADRLPFDSGRSGALAGRAARVDGPISVCFSSHDSALGVLYPIASAVSRSDAAAAEDARSRWSALGAVGAHATEMATLGKVGSDYPFDAGHLLNIDASEIVKEGPPPSGAHSDIVHEELAWVVARAGGLAG